jgi:anti-sigma regulatory factor (Ser/Thr protein kinase)
MLKLTPITFDKFIRDLNPFNKKTVNFDLSQVQFISPAVLTQLCSLCHALHKENKQIFFKVSKETGRYMARAGFVKSVENIALVEPGEYVLDKEYKEMLGLNSLLVEVTKIDDVSSLSALLDRIVFVLTFDLDYMKDEAYDIVTAISEVCQNTLDHNREIPAFLAMQAYWGDNGKFLEIGVSDYGSGLAVTLNRNKKNPHMRTDLEAINYATRQGTSEFDDPTRGTGLYHLMEFTDKHCGTVQIHTGKGKLRQRNKNRREWNATAPYLPGVHVALEFVAKNI